MQRISKLIVRNSHLALKAAIMSKCDVTSIILTRRKIENSRNPYLTDAKLRQGRSKKLSCSCSGSLTSTERTCRYQRFFDKRQSLKARIHKPKSICVELNVRQYSH